MSRTKDLRSVAAEQAFFRGMTIAQVAERLPCSPEHVHNLIKAKKLAAINIAVGKKPELRIHVQEFERFVRNNAA